MKSRVSTFIIAACIAWAVSSCSPVATAGETATLAESPGTVTFSPSKTTTQTQTPSLTPTRNLLETSILTPTQTPTATKFPGLQSTGPFIVVDDWKESIRSATFYNLQGSISWTYTFPYSQYNGISHDWKWYAYVTGSVNGKGTYPEGGVILHLSNLLTGEVRDIANLVPQDYLDRQKRAIEHFDHERCAQPGSCLASALEELNGSFHSMKWSPDGKYLAFGAMIDGDSADVYVYDIDTAKFRRLEYGPGNPESFVWSPDGQWLIYEDIATDISSNGYWMTRGETRRTVRRDGTGWKKLPGPLDFHFWISDYEYLTYFTGCCNFPYNSSPTIINLQLGNGFTYSIVMKQSNPDAIAVDPRSRMMAVLGGLGCKGDICREWGLFYGSIYGTLSKVTGFGSGYDPDIINYLHLHPRSGTVRPFTNISFGGEWAPMQEWGHLLISDNYWMAGFDEKGIRVYDPVDTLRFELRDKKVIAAAWDTNSQGLFFLDGKAVYYWALGESEPRWVAAYTASHQNVQVSLATIFNLTSLPYLRILPTRAAKPAEGTSIWSRTTYKELFQPGTNRYDITIPEDSSWRWSFSLSTTESMLFNNFLLPEDVEFLINGEKIDSNMFRMSDQTTEGRFSRAWATMLFGWRSGDKAELEIKYTLREAVRDGNVSYPAGEYRQIISLVVE
jgi:hypothetical protein